MPMQKVVVMLIVLVSAMVSLILLYATQSPRSVFSSNQEDLDALSGLIHKPAISPIPACTSNTATRDNITLSKKDWNTCLDPGSDPSAYLSIVIVTRMDDYAGMCSLQFFFTIEVFGLCGRQALILHIWKLLISSPVLVSVASLRKPIPPISKLCE